jgi:hypothetical protein
MAPATPSLLRRRRLRLVLLVPRLLNLVARRLFCAGSLLEAAASVAADLLDPGKKAQADLMYLPACSLPQSSEPQRCAACHTHTNSQRH